MARRAFPRPTLPAAVLCSLLPTLHSPPTPLSLLVKYKHTHTHTHTHTHIPHTAAISLDGNAPSRVMYGDKGPPKGYSVPRFDTNASKRCQTCSSTVHWTFECPLKNSATLSAKKSAATTVKLSPSQMLRYGIKQKSANFVSEPTEREVFDAELRELRSVLTAEVRQELKAKKSAAHKSGNDCKKHEAPLPSAAPKKEPPSDSVTMKTERTEEEE
ncbi:conserved hypothetical protein [Leishmania major strain Friedlin]|uniref:Zinc knuckle domain-containing protein n=1 Tax=Leishmania major TaxID=5664 RepID=Q4Q2C4_LEIMA|nr:conserved hypothetical protein [Leishmania major strain Friedlin]CAG9582299.1 Zinc_knuckle_-_putative [Leishmania major strain Friedlin]CAJ08144.1 conserved hypothetical protein [Leishmania major strain Friedlin]|eukprot:XP_001686524.1 conserved hypothetical protein [Leishmania major strain Friedlin]